MSKFIVVSTRYDIYQFNTYYSLRKFIKKKFCFYNLPKYSGEKFLEYLRNSFQIDCEEISLDYAEKFMNTFLDFSPKKYYDKRFTCTFRQKYECPWLYAKHIYNWLSEDPISDAKNWAFLMYDEIIQDLEENYK